jgi:hypothetical protein
LWLCGTGGRKPSPEAIRALERMLRQSTTVRVP